MDDLELCKNCGKLILLRGDLWWHVRQGQEYRNCDNDTGDLAWPEMNEGGKQWEA
jgi:hypothetical protein